jgi:hypothetical protein
MYIVTDAGYSMFTGTKDPASQGEDLVPFPLLSIPDFMAY